METIIDRGDPEEGALSDGKKEKSFLKAGKIHRRVRRGCRAKLEGSRMKGYEGDEMKKTGFRMASALVAFAIVFTCSSCSKKEEGASKSTSRKEAPMLTPEQSKRAEEIKQDVRESKHIVIATVNGAELTMFDLVREMNAVAPKIIPNGQTATPELTARVKREAMDNLIFRELAVQEAIRAGMKVRPEAIEDVINKVRAQAGSEEAYKKNLDERSMNEDALRKNIERSHLLQMITAREIFDKIRVDDRVLRKTYERDKASFMTKDNSPRQMSFEEAKGAIEAKIKTERGETRTVEWKNKLRQNADIKVMLNEVEKKLRENSGIQKK